MFVMSKTNTMKKSLKNLGVIQNFILHLTHSSHPKDGEDNHFNEEMTFTPKVIYRVADEYIEEDHVDGEENPEDHIVTYGAESSYDHEDKEKEFPEHIVIVADFGEDGTKTVATLDGMSNLKAIQDLLKFMVTPQY